MYSSKRDAYIGLAIIVFSISAFFWYGYNFKVFGGKFRFDLITLGFVGWPVLGAFGAGWIDGGLIPAMKSAFGAVLLLALAVGVVFLLGNYR